MKHESFRHSRPRSTRVGIGPVAQYAVEEQLWKDICAPYAGYEGGHIYRIVTNYALAFPHIRLSLQNENRTTFQTNGSGELLDALVAVFGLETARQMIPVAEADQTIATRSDLEAASRWR